MEQTKPNGHGMPTDSGAQLADAGIDQLTDRAGRICSAERQRIEAANQPRITSVQEELLQLQQERTQLQEEIDKLPPQGDLRARRRNAIVEWVIAAMLIIAGFGFALVALDPFPLGWKRFLYSVGLALIVPYSIDMVLQHWAHQQRFIRGVAITAAVFSIVAMGSLSLIRSQLFTEQLSSEQSAAVVIEGETTAPATAPAQDSFYKRTNCLLSIFMVLASLGMEIVAGCAVYNGRRLWVAMPANAAELKERLAMVQQWILELKHEKEALEKAPEHFVNEFWREFHRSMVHGTPKSTVTKIFCVALFCVLLVSVPRAYAAQSLNLVIAVDLTASVAGASGIR